MKTPDELLDIETELRSLRPEAPRLIVLQPPKQSLPTGWGRLLVALLCGVVIGGAMMERLRPVPPPLEIVRIVETPVAPTPLPVAQQPAPVVVWEPVIVQPEKTDLDAMIEAYNRRALLFVGIERVSTMPSPSNGSTADPRSMFRLRETINL